MKKSANDYRIYLQTVTEALIDFANSYREDVRQAREKGEDDSYLVGILHGYVFALDTIKDYAHIEDIPLSDINMVDLEPERDLLKIS